MLTENWLHCGAPDKASHYESGDSRFESWQGSYYFVSYYDRLYT